MKNPIRTICGWCSVVMVDVPQVGPLSHGICPACAAAFLAEDDAAPVAA